MHFNIYIFCLLIKSKQNLICPTQVLVTENMGPILNLLCLAAHDPDSDQNGNITYSITSGKGPFSIHPIHGLLSADKSLDYEKQSVHRLVIQAADNGVPSRKATTNVEILVQDANDAPVFSQDYYIGMWPIEISNVFYELGFYRTQSCTS